MLVLGRYRKEAIMIGDTIRITVLSNHKGQIRLGIDAPKDVPVHRLEVWEEIQRLKVAVLNDESAA